MDGKRLYSVWHDNEEQWDPNDIAKPAMSCRARTAACAAEKCAEDSDDSYGAFIVRDDEANTYRRVELVRGWTVKSDGATTLEELSAP